ncbi:MAG: energy transducer TonB, partial [Terriglobales bacterium]
MLLDKLESGIVALETECGPVYVQPSGWERLYLLWTFRHFNSLPLKTLNSRQRKLVERLPRCSVRNPRIGLDRMRVIGTVEGAKAPSFSVSLSSETAFHEGPPETVSTPAEIFSHPSSSELYEENTNLDEGSKIRPSSLARRRGHSKIAFTLAIAALIAMFAEPAWHRLQSAQTFSTPTETVPTPVADSDTIVEAKVAADQNNTAAAPIEVSSPSVDQPTLTQTAEPAKNVIASASDTAVAAPKLSIETPAAIISPLKPQADQSTIKQTPAEDRPIKIRSRENPILASIQEGKVQEETPRIQFSGPPQRLIYPEYPDTKVRGKVTLQAVIGADGRVREVKILSGNKVLSAAAARAIRQWRYNPFLKDGQRVEAETNVGVLFVAADVISISFP